MTVLKSMAIILVQRVRTTFDGFQCEKSNIFQRNISALMPRVCAGGECNGLPRCLKQIIKIKVLKRFDSFLLFGNSHEVGHLSTQ